MPEEPWLTIRCKFCRASWNAPASLLGRQIPCQECGAKCATAPTVASLYKASAASSRRSGRIPRLVLVAAVVLGGSTIFFAWRHQQIEHQYVQRIAHARDLASIGLIEAAEEQYKAAFSVADRREAQLGINQLNEKRQAIGKAIWTSEFFNILALWYAQVPIMEEITIYDSLGRRKVISPRTRMLLPAGPERDKLVGQLTKLGCQLWSESAGGDANFLDLGNFGYSLDQGGLVKKNGVSDDRTNLQDIAWSGCDSPQRVRWLESQARARHEPLSILSGSFTRKLEVRDDQPVQERRRRRGGRRKKGIPITVADFGGTSTDRLLVLSIYIPEVLFDLVNPTTEEAKQWTGGQPCAWKFCPTQFKLINSDGEAQAAAVYLGGLYPMTDCARYTGKRFFGNEQQIVWVVSQDWNPSAAHFQYEDSTLLELPPISEVGK